MNRSRKKAADRGRSRNVGPQGPGGNVLAHVNPRLRIQQSLAGASACRTAEALTDHCHAGGI
jgi:hypothetical protein